MKKFLSSHYNTRYNEVLQRAEIKVFKSEKYQLISDRLLNTLLDEIDTETDITNPSAEMLASVLNSEFIKSYHPVEQYFKNLPAHEDGNISQFSNFVNVKQTNGVKANTKDVWALCLRRWCIASVANVFIRDICANHTCIVLTGEGGAFKSSFLNVLIPKSLTEYLFSGKIVLDKPETLRLLGEKFIINLDDQLRNLNKQNSEDIKTLITQGTVSMRLPFAKFICERPRMANFIGSINGNDFLTDLSGARRFLPFEVEKIEIDKAQAFDMDKVWAEAYHYFLQGERYWFTKEEIAEWFDGNNAFSVQSQERELLSTYFQKPPNKQWSNVALTATEIKAYLEGQSRVNNLSLRKLGEALKDLGYETSRTKRNHVHVQLYFLDELSQEAISDNRRNTNKYLATTTQQMIEEVFRGN